MGASPSDLGKTVVSIIELAELNRLGKFPGMVDANLSEGRHVRCQAAEMVERPCDPCKGQRLTPWPVVVTEDRIVTAS